jgi:quercetin dioxygenase-like cupin family protein
MNTRTLLAPALALIFAASAPAKEGKRPPAVSLFPAGDLIWTDDTEHPGVRMAVVDGDPAKGPCHFLVQLKEGLVVPLHHHTSDHFGTVLSGTLSFTVDGKETLLPAGSVFVFRGKKEHVTRCMPGADCVISMDVRGKWDVVPQAKP